MSEQIYNIQVRDSRNIQNTILLFSEKTHFLFHLIGNKVALCAM